MSKDKEIATTPEVHEGEIVDDHPVDGVEISMNLKVHFPGDQSEDDFLREREARRRASQEHHNRQKREFSRSGQMRERFDSTHNKRLEEQQKIRAATVTKQTEGVQKSLAERQEALDDAIASTGLKRVELSDDRDDMVDALGSANLAMQDIKNKFRYFNIDCVELITKGPDAPVDAVRITMRGGKQLTMTARWGTVVVSNEQDK